MGCVPSLTGEKGLVFENSNHVKRLHRQIGELQSHPAVRKEKRGKRGVDK